jgi:UDP-N-acetylglucosamine 4,6-dehydratase/5-epimerase
MIPMEMLRKPEPGRYLITGGTGSLGQALADYLLKNGVKAIRIFSRDEKKQNDMQKRLPGLDYMLGDIRVIHGASLKYVHLSEVNPAEFIKTNVVGTLNVIDAIREVGTVQKVIGISSDKACRPFNAYGMTKGLLEKLFIEAQRKRGSLQTEFKVCRYGNVLATRGSVVLLWQKLYHAGYKLQVTDPGMTRFFFTMDEAIDLIFDTLAMERSDIIVSKQMRAAQLMDLAVVMAHWDEDRLEVTGHRPGEKVHEELVSDVEVQATIEVQDKLVIYPGEVKDNHIVMPFTSEIAPRLSRTEIKDSLMKIGCYDEPEQEESRG